MRIFVSVKATMLRNKTNIMTTLNEEMNAEHLLVDAKKAFRAGMLDDFEKRFIVRIQKWNGDMIQTQLNGREFKYLCDIALKGENL